MPWIGVGKENFANVVIHHNLPCLNSCTGLHKRATVTHGWENLSLSMLGRRGAAALNAIRKWISSALITVESAIVFRETYLRSAAAMCVGVATTTATISSRICTFCCYFQLRLCFSSSSYSAHSPPPPAGCSSIHRWVCKTPHSAEEEL